MNAIASVRRARRATIDRFPLRENVTDHLFGARRRMIRCLAVVALARLMAEIKSEVGVLPWAADWRLAQRAIAEGRGSSGTALDDPSALGMGAGDTTEVAAAVAGGLPGSTTTRVPTRMRR